MEKYISVKAAIEAVSADNLIDNLDTLIDSYPNMYHRAAERCIAAIPTADVRPVVLCRDCKHSAHDWQGNRYCGICKTYNTVDDDWFCADGEKWEVEHSQEPT